jgi:hypothetical protein
MGPNIINKQRDKELIEITNHILATKTGIPIKFLNISSESGKD